MVKLVTVIPARGGSKRLPGKNIRPLDGKPLIAYSIEYSKNEIPEAEVFVSTDGEDIAKVSEQYGATVLKRPDELGGDYVTSSQVLQWVSQNQLPDYNYLVLLQATNPLRPAGMIQEALKQMQEHHAESLMSVSTLIMKLGKIKEGKYVPFNYQLGQRSQDLEPLYFENGLLYITSKRMIDAGKIYDENSLPFICDDELAQVDIDTIEDFKKAEFMLNMHK